MWATELLQVVEHVVVKERPRQLRCFSLEKRRLRGTSCCLMGGNREDRARLFSEVHSDRTKVESLEL